METGELIIGVLNTLSYPISVLEEGAEGAWSQCYCNQAMEQLLSGPAGDKAAKTATENSTPDAGQTKSPENMLDSSLSALLKRYREEADSGYHTLHDVEIFDSLYTVHFNQEQKRLFLIFIEIRLEELFDNITFHDLSGSCNAIVVALDSTGKLVDMNECFSNLVGMKKEEVLGKGFFETFIPGDPEKLNRYFEEILSADVYHQHFVTPVKGPEGEVYRINWQVSKIIRQDQVFIIAVGSDISKFVEENSDLKRELTSIKLGFDYFPLAVGYMNGKGVFTKMNPRFMKMFGVAKKAKTIMFDQVPLFRKHIGFKKMNENIELIKEMSYKIKDTVKGKPVKLKVDIRLLRGKKESSKFYIVVAQKTG